MLRGVGLVPVVVVLCLLPSVRARTRMSVARWRARPASCVEGSPELEDRMADGLEEARRCDSRIRRERARSFARREGADGSEGSSSGALVGTAVSGVVVDVGGGREDWRCGRC